LRADVVRTHQVISRSGLNDLVLPCLRSTSRPLVASADSRLFQAVGPICWSAKRAASSGAVMAPSSSAASLSGVEFANHPGADDVVVRTELAAPQHVTAHADEEFEFFGDGGHEIATAE
jgi:hypothetical protein